MNDHEKQFVVYNLNSTDNYKRMKVLHEYLGSVHDLYFDVWYGEKVVVNAEITKNN